MIASPEEYTFAVDALKILTDKLASMRKHFDREGHTPEEIKRLTDPIICMLNGRQEEIDEWEKAHPQSAADKEVARLTDGFVSPRDVQ